MGTLREDFDYARLNGMEWRVETPHISRLTFADYCLSLGQIMKNGVEHWHVMGEQGNPPNVRRVFDLEAPTADAVKFEALRMLRDDIVKRENGHVYQSTGDLFYTVEHKGRGTFSVFLESGEWLAWATTEGDARRLAANVLRELADRIEREGPSAPTIVKQAPIDIPLTCKRCGSGGGPFVDGTCVSCKVAHGR